MLIKNIAPLVATEYRLKKEQKGIYSDYIRLLSPGHVLVDEFGDLDIREFDYNQISEYFTHESMSQSKTQQQNYRKVVIELFKYAVNSKLINTTEVPSLPDPDYVNNQRRCNFDSGHLDIMYDRFCDFVNASNELTIDHEVVINRREYLKNTIDFLIHTGIRPGKEIEGIRFSDIGFGISKSKDKKPFAFVEVKKGKRATASGLGRAVSLSMPAIFSIISVINHNYNDISSSALSKLSESKNSLTKFEIFKCLIDAIGGSKCADFFVFRRRDHQDAESQELTKSLNQLLEFCGIEKNHEGIKYTLYSCRHTYITNAIINGTSIQDLAQHCGTSVEMIQQYYVRISAIAIACFGIIRSLQFLTSFEWQKWKY
jgi:integrase